MFHEIRGASYLDFTPFASNNILQKFLGKKKRKKKF